MSDLDWRSKIGRKTLIMGVLNATPDSFSDGGAFACVDAAVAGALQMLADGADIIDIGGESTRPATFGDRSPLAPEVEKERVLPVIRGLVAAAPGVTISIDTYKADVAAAALDSGATLVNDISGLTADPAMARLAAQRQVAVVVMHLLGEPRNIPLKPRYHDAVREIGDWLTTRAEQLIERGIRPENILLDPGIGFGKTDQHNLQILRRLPELKARGYPLVVGTSRKKFIGKILGTDDPRDRVEGTAATVALSIAGGADIVRVHDVREMARVARMADAVVRGWEGFPLI